MRDQSLVAETIGARVRAVRAKAGLSRKRLAEKSDVSERYLNQLENGDANVSVGILARVADALAVDLVALIAAGERTHARPFGDSALHAPLGQMIGRLSLREQEGLVPVVERYLAERSGSLKGIALLGLRGAGKTTLGSLFAARHGLPFLSVTREIETRAGMSLNDLFNLGGPDAYRTLENDVVKELSSRSDRIVLETAGGIVANGSALDQILASFKTIWLKASPEEHLNRVIGQGDFRPMQATPKALEHLKTLLSTREPEYARADCVLDTSGRTPEACIDELEHIAAAVMAA